jgi:mutual gliding-motility protein MglA
MVFFNWATMQMAAKIVYYGPGLCGKTTNLSYIYAKTSPGSRGEMVSLETETDRTLFFDLLPLEVGKVGGFRTRLQLYTVPGQVFYNTTRKLVLKGVDGVVFVADSQKPMADANIESFRNLDENLRELGLDIKSIPLVLQFNKRDLKNIASVEELHEALNPNRQWEGFESVAVQGLGVFETLKAITKSTLKALRRRMAAQETVAAPAPQTAPAPRPQVAFNPAALSAAVVEGLAAPPRLVIPPIELRNAAAVIESLGGAQPAIVELPAAPPAGVATEAAQGTLAPEETPTAEEVEVVTEAAEGEEAVPAEEAAEAEEIAEAEEAPVEFATTPEPAVAEVEREVRHVKVSSSLDILAELESLRKAATSKPTHQAQAGKSASLDLDALLQSSINSRQEVRRRVDENVGAALARAHTCRVRIDLVDAKGDTVKRVDPVEVELKKGERVRQLALTLTVHLQGE